MPPRDPINWMLSEAIETLARAERLQQQFLNLQPFAGTHEPSWEPPIDVFESERDLLIVVALPGVDTQDIEISSEGAILRVAGVRRLPAAVRGTDIVRLEIPQGRFERRIRLPAARWELSRSSLVNGCLLLNLTKQT